MNITLNLTHLRPARVCELTKWVDYLNKFGSPIDMDEDKLELRYCDITHTVYLISSGVPTWTNCYATKRSLQNV